MPKRGDIVLLDGDVAIYVGETQAVDGDGNPVDGALVHVLPPPTVVPAASLSEVVPIAPPPGFSGVAAADPAPVTAEVG